ncbi:MAG: VWA domain-containing protein [Armatimonadetes bacterium]|nr:VWA domain-containing protein [Armatimonadota bacterium]
MIQFTKPLWLLTLIPLGYFTYRMAAHSLADLSSFRSRLALVLRSLIIFMLVFALAGARTVQNVSQRCVVFVMDVSDSVPKEKQLAALGYVNRALKQLKSENLVGVIAFGADASVELAPTNIPKVDKIYSIPSTGNTDISQALGLALALFPEKCAKKIVLLSDGNETRGKAIEQAMLINSNDVSVDVVPLANELPHEVLLDKMVCPSGVKVGEPFDLKAVAIAKEAVAAQIRLLRNGVPVGVKGVQLTKGKSVLTFQQSIDKPGSYEFEAILECGKDTRMQNNTALAYSMVKGKPKVLYVEGVPGQAKYLAEALKRSDIEVEARDRSGIPSTLAHLRGYDMVVLSDVPAFGMSAEQMLLIESGVKDLGVGFTMIGGEDGFGAGGYFDTPVEKALPVDTSVRKTKVLPSLSVVVVMDKSGSMGASEGGMTKMQLANDGAAAVVKLLQPIDYVGVIVCHTSPVTAVKLQSAKEKGPIYEQISTIRAEGGGIAVFPSMRMAYDMIRSSRTRQKHIILLADGADCDDQEGAVPLAKQMAGEKITVTAVAIGDGPHVPFLKNVAAAGRGNFYLTLRASDLKAIFTKDVMTVSKSLIVEEPFVPTMDPSSPELSGITAVPALLGYVTTSPKPTARVSMISKHKDPILATWQYGLGKSAAFTSDCKARWSSHWVSWPDYGRFWAQVLRSTMRKNPPTDFQTVVEVENGVGSVTIDAVDDKGNFLNQLDFKGSVVGPSMKGKQLAIEQTGPGRYEAAFDAREVGSYVVNVVRRDQDQTSPDVNVVTIPYPPEYKDIAPNTALLRQIASETRGRFDPEPSEVFTQEFRRSRAYNDLWRLLVILAAVLLPLDVAVRRITITSQQFMEEYDRAREFIRALRIRRRAGPAAEQGPEIVSSLLRAKREREPVKKVHIETEAIAPGSQPRQPSEPGQRPAQASPSEPKPASEDATLSSRLLDAKRKRKRD